MQRLRVCFLRFCSLAVCSVLCLQPLTAFADVYAYDSIDVTNGLWICEYILAEVDANYNEVAELSSWSKNFSDDSVEAVKEYQMKPCKSNQILNGTNMYNDEIRILRTDGDTVALANESVVLNLSNLVFRQRGYDGTYVERDSNIDIEEIEKFSVSVVSTDGEIQECISLSGEEITNELVMSATTAPFKYYHLYFKLESLPFDVCQYIINIYTGADAWNNNNVTGSSSTNGTDWVYQGVALREFGATNKGTLTYEVEEASTAGLIGGIIEWIKKIYDSIVSLPQRIWAFIQAGLMELFVPDETFMLEYKENWDVLLSDSLGGVYEAVQLVDDTAQLYLDGGYSSGQIDFPMVHVPVSENEDFTFGGWSVDILPEVGRFHVLLDALKLITNALATFYVIDAFKRRFERTLEG